MQNEIDSSNIIAALVKDKADNNLIVSYHQIRDVANSLESILPTLLATYDLMSIDAFRCLFIDHVKMGNNHLTINNLKEIQGKLNKLLPSQEITEFIINISKESYK